MVKREDLSDEQWAILKPLFPEPTKRADGRSRPRRETRGVADRSGFPLAVHLTSASPHEFTLVHDTLKERFFRRQPLRLIGDRAYDSDKLDAELHKERIELISHQRGN